MQNLLNLQKAVIYTRVSSKEQEKEGFSIPAQLKLLREYASENGFVIIHEFIDVETAKQSGRTGFNEMLKYLKSRSNRKNPDSNCRIILVEKTDRLYRNFKDYVIIDDLDLEIHLVKENSIISQDSRSSEKFVHGIKVLMAKNYIDNLSEETKKGMLEKAEQGLYPGCAPFGYNNVEINGKKVIEPDPDLMAYIVRLFELYATGDYSILEVTNIINSEGLSYKKTGNKLVKSTIHKILTNPVYGGSFLWKGKLYSGTHKPIISKELFDHVQEIIEEKRGKKTRKQIYDWAFRGLLSCGHCYSALSAEIQKGRYIYYHCTGYRGKCPEKYVREEEVARQFGVALSKLHFDKEVLDWIIVALRESHKDEKKYHDEMMTTFQQQYTKLQNRIDVMYIDKLDGKISQTYFEEKSAEWRNEQQDILRKIEKFQKSNIFYLDEGIKLLELANNAVELYQKQAMSEKRRLLNYVFSNSLWKDGKLYPVFRKPFDLIAVTNAEYKKEKAANWQKSDLSEFLLRRRGSNPHPGAPG